LAEDKKGLDKLFYELANESRLEVLHELLRGELRLLEIARILKLTDTEASRQLQRLTDALLVQKQPNGTYAITQYGTLIMHYAMSFKFALKFKKALLNRDIWKFPTSFVDRMWEFNEVQVSLDPFALTNIFEMMIDDADKSLHVLWAQPPPVHLLSAHAVARARVIKNFDFMTVFAEEKGNFEYFSAHYDPVVQRRTVKELPGTMGLSDKSCVIAVGIENRTEAREEYAVFHGKDPAFLNWANDLFDYYWQRGKPYTEGKPKP